MNDKILISSLLVIVVCLTPLFPLHEANGDIRDDIAKLKKQITTTENDITKQKAQVETDKQKIEQQEVTLKNADKTEREARNAYDLSPTSDNTTKLKNAISSHSNAFKKLQDLQKDLRTHQSTLRKSEDKLVDQNDKLENLEKFLKFNYTLKRDGKRIGIALSKTCIILLQNNYTTNCPRNEEIMSLYPDTSNQQISGSFIKKDGIIQRGNPNVINHYKYYDYTKEIMVWTDPPSDVREKFRMITIAPDVQEYFDRFDMSVRNNTIYTFDTRIVAKDCTTAIIDSDQWGALLGDTIYYMQNDCKEGFTNLNNTIVNQRKNSYIDITTSYKYQLDKWFKEAKEKSKNAFLINPNKTLATNEIQK